MLRIQGFEGGLVEDLDQAVVVWQGVLKEKEPDKVMQVVDAQIHIKDDPETPLLFVVVYALIPRRAGGILVPAANG